MQRTDRKTGRVIARLAPWVVGLLALAALWVWADRLLPGGDQAGMAVLGPDDCDLNLQACTAQLPSGLQVSLDLQPRPMPTLQPLEVRLELTGQDPEWVELDLAGVEMYMGFNRSRLERVAPGSYRGQTVLPVCASEAMTWAATVLPEGEQERTTVQFRFLTRR
ncbi:MAG: hypothetical protein LC667_13340 [Thioalkalivibrio sp.]|nr:hypothetical protein [Thioalkalivibrio sp.]